jgi:peptide/nickel transport system ATP-binding protein
MTDISAITAVSPRSEAEPYLRLSNLDVTFLAGRAPVHAVNGVDLAVAEGETLALIGESGSGKSVTLRALMRLNPPRRTKVTGEIRVGGRDVMKLDAKALSHFRGGEVAMIFQEPLLALDPVFTIGQQITEAIRRHETISREDARARALSLFERVRIPSPQKRLDTYPHEMSGGMR